MHAAPLAHHLARILAAVEPATGTDRGKFHALFAAVSRAMADTPRSSSLLENLNSRLRTDFTLRRHLGGSYLDLLRFFLNHRRFMLSRHAERQGKKPARADDRPRPSALADPARPGTASAPAGLTREGEPPPTQDALPSRYPALTGRPFPRASCNPKRADSEPRQGPLHLLTRYVTHSELRAVGKKRLVRHLQAAGGLPNVDALADRALAAAAEQIIVAPAERMIARVIRELAAEALVSRARLVELDRGLKALLGRHPDAALILSLPGMGVVLTAELIAKAGNLSRFCSADALASAAGMAPVLR